MRVVCSCISVKYITAMKFLLFSILLVCSNARKRETIKRFHREAQAGYTQDLDTCKEYNENLKKMWGTLSKFMNSSDTISDTALHNIAVMIQAYLEHQHKDSLEQSQVNRQKITNKYEKKDKISTLMQKVTHLLGNDNAVEYITKLILENFKPKYNGDINCKQINENNLLSSMDLAYKIYAENAKCLNSNNDVLTENNMQLRGSRTSEEMIFDDKVSSKSSHRDSNYRLKQRVHKRKSNYPNDRHKISVKERRQPLLQLTNIENDRRQKKSDVRIMNSCVKDAMQTFIVSMRGSIKRFLALNDCHQDRTLRSGRNYGPMIIANKQFINDRPPKYLKDVNQDRTMKYIMYNNLHQNPLLSQFNKRPDEKEYAKYNWQSSEKYFNNHLNQHNYPESHGSMYKLPEDSNMYFKNIQTEENTDRLKSNLDVNGRNIEKIYLVVKKHRAEGNIKPFYANQQSYNSNHPLIDIINPLGNKYDHKDTNPYDPNVNLHVFQDVINLIQGKTLETQMFDISNSASETKKGLVEITYLVKYPKSIIYRPQYLVKHILQYEDFLKIANKLKATNDNEKQLVKIVRYLPDSRQQLFFETDIYNSALRVIDENASHMTTPLESLLSQNNISSAHKILQQKNAKDTVDVNQEIDYKTDDDLIRVQPLQVNMSLINNLNKDADGQSNYQNMKNNSQPQVSQNIKSKDPVLDKTTSVDYGEVSVQINGSEDIHDQKQNFSSPGLNIDNKQYLINLTDNNTSLLANKKSGSIKPSVKIMKHNLNEESIYNNSTTKEYENNLKIRDWWNPLNSKTISNTAEEDYEDLEKLDM